MIGGPLALALASAQAAPAAAAVPNEILFADYALGGWRLKATTHVEAQTGDDGRRYPVVGNISCEISRDGLLLYTDRSGRSRVTILRIWDGGERAFSALNIDGLGIGRVDYRARGVDTGHGPYRFLDADYPDGFAEVLTTNFSGHLAVRRGDDGPWLNVDYLLADILRAPTIRVTYWYWSRDGHNVRRHARYTIPLDGAAAAFERCQSEIASQAAFRLTR